MQKVKEIIDKLTNSIENAITGERFSTDLIPVSAEEIKIKDWVFDWKIEIKTANNKVFKLITHGNEDIIQGLICIADAHDHIVVILVESAKFNKGKTKQYLGVAGNLFAFACKYSFDLGYDGYVAFDSKTALKQHYNETLGAKVLFGNRMIIETKAAQILVNRYYNHT